MSAVGVTKILDCGIEEAVERVTEVLKTKGFGVLTTIDSQKVIKAKLGLDIKPYRILGACNPKFAHQIISIDPVVGVMLPCNVVVYENDEGKIGVVFTNVMAKFAGYMDSPHAEEMKPIAAEVDAGIKAAYEAL